MMTIKNKVLAILLAMAFNAFAAAWTGSNSEPENMKKIDGKAFYVITTADELAWFAVQVNSGRSAINAVLGNDIVFGANNSSTCTAKWTPIGNSTSAQFAGILDGAGHTIYGLYTNEISLAGLVGVLGKNGIVRNLNTTVGNINGTLRSGGIVAHNVGLVQNVKNGNKVNVSTSTETAVYAGGIVAHNEGSVENCSSSGAIKASSTTNTALGIAKARAGGIAGHSTGSIVNSINSGSVSSFARAQNPNKYGEAFAGGIAGYNSSIVKICKNGGAVVAQGSGDNTGEFISRSAGIVGYNAANVNNCSNTGSTSIKRIYESDDKSYFTTDYSKSCPSCVGGIVAFGEVKNSFDVVSYKYWLNGGAIQGAAENMKKDQFAWILNTTNGTTSNSGVWSRTDGYPIFATETNKPIYKVVFNDEGVTTNRYTSNKGLASFPENPEPAEGFVFTGWYNANDVRVKPTTVFTADQTVNAVYVDASEVFWTINFFNTDAKSTLLETKSYQHGSIVTYGGETPTKETTAQYTYTFKVDL